MEAEVLAMIKSLPLDKTPGSNGFIAWFLQAAWSIIWVDLMVTFDTFWRMDMCIFYGINEALLVLLPKSPEVVGLKDYRPIALIHLLGKLFSKVFTPKLSSLIHLAQSAFINGRCIQDNFKVNQTTSRIPHARKTPSLLLKVGISRAFDSVA
jgi:hypothetical protein